MPTSGSPRRRRRLAEELEEEGLALDEHDAVGALLLEEIDHALRPAVHEGRVASGGAFVEPRSDPATWEAGANLTITRGLIDRLPLATARLFADGLSSWMIRRADGTDEWMVFDRPAGSERDLVVLADVLDATIVQRHPAGAVRIVGALGVLRWQGLSWYHEPPASAWIDTVAASADHGDAAVVEDLLKFAIHDLGSTAHRRAPHLPAAR